MKVYLPPRVKIISHSTAKQKSILWNNSQPRSTKKQTTQNLCMPVKIREINWSTFRWWKTSSSSTWYNKINGFVRNNATRTVACAAVAWFRLPREIRDEAGRGITVNLSSSPSKKTANYYKAIIKVLKSFLCKDTRIETKYTYRVRWCRVPHDCSVQD